MSPTATLVSLPVTLMLLKFAESVTDRYMRNTDGYTQGGETHLSLLNNADFVRPFNRAEAVCDEDDGHAPPCYHIIDRLLHEMLALCVQRAVLR